MSELLFHNASVYTMDPARPRAAAVAVRDGRIAAVGRGATAAVGSGAERIDCQSGVLIPGFIDAHCHLLSYAASLRSVDCSPARSIADIQRAISERAATTEPGRWVRAFGYEETSLAERRHPTRADLDTASEHPVRLIHRSGHASVLNSLALRELSIAIDTEERPGASIERDLTTGEPNGVLIEMEDVIDRALPRPPYEEVAAGVREASRCLLRAGIVCAQDASHTNGPGEWRLFERLLEDGSLPLDVVLMEGWEHFGWLPERGAAGRLRRGPVKVMLRELGGRLQPDESELARIVADVHDAGRQVAVHAVSEEAVLATIRAIAAAVRRRPRADHRHRIEHCSQLPVGCAPEIARPGIVVVSQPSLIHERGDRYLALVPEEELERLYAFRTLGEAGVRLAASSDAPVTAPAPLASIAAAVDRLAASGRAVGQDQTVPALEALGWWSAGAAFAAGLESERGSIRPGLRADLALLPPNAFEMPPEQLRGLAPLRVWLAGTEIQFEAAILDR